MADCGADGLDDLDDHDDDVVFDLSVYFEIGLVE